MHVCDFCTMSAKVTGRTPRPAVADGLVKTVPVWAYACAVHVHALDMRAGTWLTPVVGRPRQPA